MRRRDQLVERVLKLLGIGDLLLRVLLLQHPVEVWHNVSVDLPNVSSGQWPQPEGSLT